MKIEYIILSIIILYYVINNYNKTCTLSDYILLIIISIIILYKILYCSVNENFSTSESAADILANNIKILQTDNGVFNKDLLVTGDIYSNGTIILPIGTVIPFTQSTIPNGWHICDGTPVSSLGLNETDEANLIFIIGSTLPDLQGRIVVGADQGTNTTSNGLTSRPILDMSGEENHVLTEGEMPQHTHNIENVTQDSMNDASGNHTHNYTSAPSTYCTCGGSFASCVPNAVYLTSQSVGVTPNSINHDANGNHAHTINTTGSSTAHNNIMPSYILNYIIRLK